MSESDYYTLQKQVQNLRKRVACIDFQQKIAPAQERLQKLENTYISLGTNMREMVDIICQLNENAEAIENRFRCTDYIGMPRNCTPHFKTIHTKILEIFDNPLINNKERLSEVCLKEGLTEHDISFLGTVRGNLQRYNQYKNNIGSLIGFFAPERTNEAQNHHNASQHSPGADRSDLQSDDTIITIKSENVIASSPVPAKH